MQVIDALSWLRLIHVSLADREGMRSLCSLMAHSLEVHKKVLLHL